MSGETLEKHCLSKFKALLESICAQYEAITGASDENDPLNEIWLAHTPLDLDFSGNTIHVTVRIATPVLTLDNTFH